MHGYYLHEYTCIITKVSIYRVSLAIAHNYVELDTVLIFHVGISITNHTKVIHTYVVHMIPMRLTKIKGKACAFTSCIYIASYSI